MNKYEFLYKLGKALENSTARERNEIIGYYEELIQDAIDNKEDEERFIERLGSIDKIVRTMRKDEGFVENVKQKKDFQLANVFSNSVKIIGHLIFFFFVFVLGSIAFSFVTSGAALGFYSIVRLIAGFTTGIDFYGIMLFAGSMMLGVGLLLLGIWMFQWMIQESKGKLEKLLESIQALIKKEGN